MSPRQFTGRSSARPVRRSSFLTATAGLSPQDISRRGVLLGALGLGGAAVLSACGVKGQATASTARAAVDKSSDMKLHWSNWPLYLDVDDKATSAADKYPTLKQFKEATGITVTYTEDINDNPSYFAKIKPALAAHQDPGTDLIVLTDYMAARLVRLGWVQKFNAANIPNAKNLSPAMPKSAFDPDRQYSLPWQSGLTAIAYNEKATGGTPVTSIKQMLTDPALKGRVALLNEMTDCVALVLQDLGYDASKFTDEQFNKAIQMIDDANKSGQIRAFTGNDYVQDLQKGDLAACMAYSGDIMQLQADTPEVKFVIPEAGCELFSDNFLIPNQAQHKTNAEKLINFYYQPDIAATVEDYVNYICPVAGAQEALTKLDPDIASNELVFPTDATLAKAHPFMAMTAEQENSFNKAFNAIVS